MFCRKSILLTFFLSVIAQYSNAQIAKSVDEMETANKVCLKIKSDSGYCSKLFQIQMDSMLNVVFEKVKTQVSVNEKSSLIEEQVSWAKKKGEYFKKLDETFVYNLQEGVWKKDMIRISYQQKAEYVFKRIKALLKRLKE